MHHPLSGKTNSGLLSVITLLGLLAVFLLLPRIIPTGSTFLAAPRPDSAPQVAGLQQENLLSAVQGRVLIGELGCTACHSDPTNSIEHRPGPELIGAANRLMPAFFQRFLESPKFISPGTNMPDALRHLADDKLAMTVDDLAAYLRSFGSAAPTAEAIDEQAALRGEGLYKSIGCKACHNNNNSRFRKYSVTSLQEFLLAPHKARPAQRMPDMNLTPAEAFDLSNYWLSSRTPWSAPNGVDTSRVAAGRSHFAALGCANCHSLPDSERPPSIAAEPLDKLEADKGCLSGNIGLWPHYALSPEQMGKIRNALTHLKNPLTKEERVQQLLASRNCFACHDRGDIKSNDNLQDIFLTHDASIGQEGRFPPSLTGVGAKLQANWLRNAIAHGQSERPYLKSRMPGFGDEIATKLTKELSSTDTLPAVTIEAIPTNRKEAEVIKKLGRELVGDKGMNCITCHLFAGEKAGAMGAIDLVHSTGKRLTPEWFSNFLREPFRFKPNTLMPKFFPDGKSIRPELANGDVNKQIDAMWHYLSKGRNVSKPSGIHRPAIELDVGNHAVMLRRSVQNTGKRGISVGYPGGVNITFDAEDLGLNQIWWGRFVDARPVWTGQGSGQAHILSRKRESLVNGPLLAKLTSIGDSWPKQTRRERGDRFLGYRLDKQQRPTFRYTSADVVIEDAPSEATAGGATILRRGLTFSGEDGSYCFRIARHKQIKQIDEATVRVGRSLVIKSRDGTLSVVEDGEEIDVRLMIPIEGGTKAIQLDYAWTEAGK